VRHRRSPVAHTVRAHMRNGKTVRSYPRGEGKRRTRIIRVVQPTSTRFRLGGQMKDALETLQGAEKGLTLTELILSTENMEDMGRGDGKLRLTSGVAGKTVTRPNTRAMITFAMMENTYPELKESPLAKQVRGNLEKNRAAQREAEKLYASYSRTVKNLMHRGLVSSNNIQTRREIVYDGSGESDRLLEIAKEIGALPKSASYKTTKGPAQGRTVGYFITEKGQRLLKAA